MDLFQLRGVLVEKEPPSVDLFSLRGVILEKEPPFVSTGRLKALLAQDTSINSQVVNMRALIAQTQSGYVNLPTDITGIERFKTLVQSKMTVTANWASKTIGPPKSVSEGPLDLTEVEIGTLEPSNYRGKITVTYRRRSISVLAPLKLVPSQFTTVQSVIDHIAAAGWLISAVDVDIASSEINSETITLVAGNNSYFFYPGSRVVFGIAPVLPNVEFAFSSLVIAPKPSSFFDFTRSSRYNLFTLINSVSAIGTISQDQLEISELASIEEEDANSSILVEPTELIRYQGSATIKYSRIPLAYAFEGKEEIVLPQLSSGSLVAQLGVINTTFGISLSENDIVDAEHVEGDNVVLIVKDTSWLFSPGTTVVLSQTPTLSGTFVTKSLSGFAPEA